MLLMLLLLPAGMVAQKAASCSKYIATYESSTQTLTFKEYAGETLPSNSVVVKDKMKVADIKRNFENGTIVHIVFDKSFSTYTPTSLYCFFENLTKLETITGLEYLNTEKVTDMSCMFYRCSSLTSLDVTHFNTAKVTNMSCMFWGCSSLTSLYLTNFNTAEVTNMSSMFASCSSLTSLYLTNFNTAKVTNMSSMFASCSSLTSLDVTHFNTAEVTDMNRMFSGCSSLTSLDVTNFNTANVTNMRLMFSRCSSLISLDVTHFNTAEVTNMSYMFYSCSSLTSLDVTYFNTAKVTDMSYMFYRCLSLTSLYLTNFNTAKVTDMNNMFSACQALATIYASSKFVTTQVSSGSDMFTGCEKLKGYNDSKTDHTFANGYFTPVFDYAEFATGTLTFRRSLSKPAGAYDLNEGNNEPGWLTQKENIYKVVFDASFAKARPTSCYKWFWSCDVTQIEGIENLNTEEVTNMHSMFSGCLYLTSLDVSKFDTQKVEDMSDMFASCTDLESLNVSNFDTQKVKDMNDMFYNCTGLTSLDVSNFNTQNVEDMSFMFSSCFGLTSLDLSNFDTKEVTNMSNMFWNSSALKTIYVSDKFVTAKVTKSNNMFSGCKSLKGFIEQNKNTDKIDHTYANYKTGYFSKLVGKNGSEKIGAAGETLATDNLVLADDKDFVAYEPFAAKAASYNRTIKTGTTWGTLCLPFAIAQSQVKECKFYRLTGIDNDNKCITLESYEEGAEIPAGTPVLFKMNEGVQKLSISVQNTDLVKEPVAGTNTDVNLVGSFTKIGGKDNQGLDKNDYIISKNKFWRVSDLTGGKGVGSKPMHAYIHPATASQARAAMLSIGKGDGTTAIDNLNAISNDANAEYYDANGRRTNGLQKGLNIVKRGSKTYKIMVK